MVTTRPSLVPLTATTVLGSIWPLPLMPHATLSLIILVLKSSLVAILATPTTNHRSFVLSFRLSIPKIYLAAIYLSYRDIVNQFSCHIFIYVGNKAKAPTLPGNWISHYLSFLHLPELAKVHCKFTISQCVV